MEFNNINVLWVHKAPKVGHAWNKCLLLEMRVKGKCEFSSCFLLKTFFGVKPNGPILHHVWQQFINNTLGF
jgi:hypothetical protein